MKIRTKIFRMLLAIISLTLVAVVAYGFTFYNYSASELSKTYKSFSSDRASDKMIEQTQPLTILLMGVDTGSAERTDTWAGNSDSMIVLTINPKTKTTTMTSLERDILINIVNKNGKENGTQFKLNSAYADGGAEMAIQNVEKLLNLKIDKYVMLNMHGLVQLVDAVGGITVNNTLGFPISISEQEPEYTAVVEPGKQTINGDQALVYSRMRYDDPEGDYGRQKRQREVIQLIVKKVLSLNSVSAYTGILEAISENMQTDVYISTATIPSLLGYSDALKNIETYQLSGEDAMIDGASYQLPTAEHLLEIQNNIRLALGRKKIDSLETNAVTYDDYISYGGVGALSTYNTQETVGLSDTYTGY